MFPKIQVASLAQLAQIPEEPASLYQPRGCHRVDSVAPADSPVVSRRNPHDAAGEITLPLQQAAPLIEHAGEAPADIAEADERQISEHQPEREAVHEPELVMVALTVTMPTPPVS